MPELELFQQICSDIGLRIPQLQSPWVRNGHWAQFGSRDLRSRTKPSRPANPIPTITVIAQIMTPLSKAAYVEGSYPSCLDEAQKRMLETEKPSRLTVASALAPTFCGRAAESGHHRSPSGRTDIANFRPEFSNEEEPFSVDKVPFIIGRGIPQASMTGRGEGFRL